MWKVKRIWIEIAEFSRAKGHSSEFRNVAASRLWIIRINTNIFGWVWSFNGIIKISNPTSFYCVWRSRRAIWGFFESCWSWFWKFARRNLAPKLNDDSRVHVGWMIQNPQSASETSCQKVSELELPLEVSSASSSLSCKLVMKVFLTSRNYL